MRNRWVRLAVMTVALLAMNAVARVIVHFWVSDTQSQLLVGLYSMIGMAVLAACYTFVWMRRHEVVSVVGEIGLVVLVGCILAVLVGPLVVGSVPFAEDVQLFFGELGLTLLVCGIGALVGGLVAMTFGQDWKGKAYKRQAEYFARKRSRRPARR